MHSVEPKFFGRLVETARGKQPSTFSPIGLFAQINGLAKSFI
jgi:hypothetical protein